MKKWLVPIIALFFGACGNEDYSKDVALNGLDESQIIEKLETPLRETIIPIHNTSKVLEYQSDLLALTKDLKEVDTVLVKEMYWEYEKSNQVIWLTNKQGAWTVFDNLSWSKEIQF